jgi:putative aldouronate transport system permease protein
MKGRCSLSQAKQPALSRNIRPSKMSWKTYLRRYGTLYLLLILPMAFFIIFRYTPMTYILLAFKKNNILVPPWEVPWAKNNGFEWFIKAFQDQNFIAALRNTIFLNLLDLVIGTPMPIIMALLLNELAFPKYKRVTQTILYLPHFLSWVIISSISLRLFATNDGMINKLFGTSIPFLGTEGNWRAMYIVLGIWKECGWNTIIYLAALSGVDPELHEADRIDGANKLQRVLNIDIPCILPTIIILLVMDAGHILGVGYEKVFLMQNDMNLKVSEVISTYVYKVGLVQQKFSFSTAIGLMNNVINFVLLMIVNKISNKLSGIGLW